MVSSRYIHLKCTLLFSSWKKKNKKLKHIYKFLISRVRIYCILWYHYPLPLTSNRLVANHASSLWFKQKPIGNLYKVTRLMFMFELSVSIQERNKAKDVSSVVHLAYELPPAVHTQVIIGFLPSDSHLAAEGVCLHYELGLWRDRQRNRQTLLKYHDELWCCSDVKK